MKEIVARSPKWNTVECLICWFKCVYKLMQTAFQFSGMFNASQVETLSSALTSPELSPCKKCPINQVILMQLPLANRRHTAMPGFKPPKVRSMTLEARSHWTIFVTISIPCTTLHALCECAAQWIEYTLPSCVRVCQRVTDELNLKVCSQALC